MKDIYNEKVRNQISKEFEWIGDKIYLDHAGAGLYSSEQIKCIGEHLCSNLHGNPHSLSDISKSTTDAVDHIRIEILKWFKTVPEEYTVIFTSGATSAIKLLFESFQWHNGSFMYTQSNHTSVIGGRILAQKLGATTTCIPDEKISTFFTRIEAKQYYELDKNEELFESNGLFAYPAQCNFSGDKFPLEWVKLIQMGCLNEIDAKKRRWFCLLDAATFCATSELNLGTIKPDFVCLSFYKIFGYPTGLGALLVKNTSADTAFGSLLQQRNYFGGGTVDVSLPSGKFYRLRKQLHERFEDGTLPFLSIISLNQAFKTFQRLKLNMAMVSLNVTALAKQTGEILKNIVHWNDAPLVEIYSNYESQPSGGILALNLRRSDGSYIGYNEVQQIANLHKIQLRTGCFCNVGACQKFLKLSDEDLLTYFQAGHVCGDDRDLIDGRPTGAVRISFGLSSSPYDAKEFVKVIQSSFVESSISLGVPFSNTLCSTAVKLEQLVLYPIKSCGGFKVKSWSLNERGLKYDRHWMVTEKGVALTQKQEPRLCKVRPIVDLDSGALTLSYDDYSQITVDYIRPYSNKEQIVKVCTDKVHTFDCGDDVANWLSNCLEKENLRLVCQNLNEDQRLCTIAVDRGRLREPSGKLSLANQAQLLLINKASVDCLKQRMLHVSDLNIDTITDRFRANMVISGEKEFEEINWKSFKMSNVKFDVEGFCTRCQMICIDQSTGEKNRKPLVELSRALNGKLRFGIYCSFNPLSCETAISIGDAIYVEYS